MQLRILPERRKFLWRKRTNSVKECLCMAKAELETLRDKKKKVEKNREFLSEK